MKILYGEELANTIRSKCDNITSCLWLAVHYIGDEKSIRKIIGRKWLENKSVSVRLLIDTTHIHKIDTKIVEIFSSRGQVKLLQGLHAKLYIFDDECVLTSANLTETAFSKRYEIGVLLQDVTAKEIKDIFQQWWMSGEHINSTKITEMLFSNTNNPVFPDHKKLPVL